MMDGKDLGDRLKELRASKAKSMGQQRITQREIAKHLGISAGAYASWESGRTRPDLNLLPQIADYFKVSIDFLLGYTVSVRTARESITTRTGLTWSLRRMAQTDNEKKGLEVWRCLVEGMNPETMARMGPTIKPAQMKNPTTPKRMTRSLCLFPPTLSILPTFRYINRPRSTGMIAKTRVTPAEPVRPLLERAIPICVNIIAPVPM